MTTVRTISGIPDETWEKAKDEYTTVSGKIKELLEQDLRVQEEKQKENIDLLKNSDLTNKQMKVAEHIMSKGGTEKNSTQVNKVIAKQFSDNKYRSKCKKAIINDENVPFVKHGRGIKSRETVCPDCEASNPLKVLRKTGFECANCGKRLYDLD